MVRSCWRPLVGSCEGGCEEKSSSTGKLDGLLWHKDLGQHMNGEFSMAIMQANGVIEDQSQLESGSFGTFVGVYDGHGGPQAAQFVNRSLFLNLKKLATENEGISEDVVRKAFLATDKAFMTTVKKQWIENPCMASVGTCCLVGLICNGNLYTANAGDSRAVLGRSNRSSRYIEAVQLSNDHNAVFESERMELRSLHPYDPEVIVLRRNVWRVKGIIQVTRSIGDAYLKNPEYNKAPLPVKFRVPQPFNKPILKAEPTISIRRLEAEDRFIVFASDGLWEHLGNQEVVDIVHNSPRNGIAKRLIKAALQEAAKKREMRCSDLRKIAPGVRRHFHDDITVIVVFLDHSLISGSGNSAANLIVPLSMQGGA
ncbi:hypothetical protein V2J09_010431 [Rumex salicifolius]